MQERIRQCRSCGAELDLTFLDLGDTPLANAYPASEEEAASQPTYPLHARVCEQCTLVQLDHSIEPSVLFEDYAYFSSYSDSWLQHSADLARWSVAEFGLSDATRVVEIASNDGYLLKHFIDLGVQVLGVEPAANVAKAAIADGVPTDVRFFGSAVAEDLRDAGNTADVLIGNNVVAHVPDLNDFIEGLRILLKKTGVISLEFPHLLRLIEKVQFDTIYHEHFSYFSLHSLEKVLNRHQLEVFDVHELPTHGGSLRVLAGHPGNRRPGDGLPNVKKAEAAASIEDMAIYEGFRQRVEHCKVSLLSFLARARSEGKTVVAYGAAAKGSTLLNYCGVTVEDIPYAMDRSPHKQGRLIPGSRIPIRPPEHVLETKPPYILILPWNLKTEIIDQLQQAREWGAKFVTPVPEIEVS